MLHAAPVLSVPTGESRLFGAWPIGRKETEEPRGSYGHWPTLQLAAKYVHFSSFLKKRTDHRFPSLRNR
jgi:hypothetical protein